MFFKFLLFFLGVIYLLRLISPFLFKLMISSFIKKATQSSSGDIKPEKKKKSTSESLGEYIDYEEVD